MSRCTRNLTICICENKGADQIRSNCEVSNAASHKIIQFAKKKIPVFSGIYCMLQGKCTCFHCSKAMKDLSISVFSCLFNPMFDEWIFPLSFLEESTSVSSDF